ncbi:MAG: amidohydrolase family protein [Bacteroidales bacterium]
MIIDAHAHIFSQVNGRKQGVKTKGFNYGCISAGTEILKLLPPLLKDTTFDAGMLIALMDSVGVDKAILLQNPLLGIVNDEIAKAIRQYPERFKGTIQVDPLDSNAVNQLKRWYSESQNTLKLEMSNDWGWTGVYPDLKLNDPLLNSLWETVAELRLQVIFDTGAIGNPGYQTEYIDMLTNKYSNTKFLIEHLAYLTSDKIFDQSAIKQRLDLVEIARKPNVFLGFSATPSLLNDDYPCPLSLEVLKQTVELVGAEKIIWGSDVPITLCRYTYKQMIDLIKDKANFLSEKEKNDILYNNAFYFFGWDK